MPCSRPRGAAFPLMLHCCLRGCAGTGGTEREVRSARKSESKATSCCLGVASSESCLGSCLCAATGCCGPLSPHVPQGSGRLAHRGPRVQGQGDRCTGQSHSVGAGWPKDGQWVEVLLTSSPNTGRSVSFFLKAHSSLVLRSCTRHAHLRGPAAGTDCARSGRVPSPLAGPKSLPPPVLHFPIL